MAQPVYATVDDLAADLGDQQQPPANAERMLRDASRDVDDLIVSAIYSTGPDEMPLDDEIREALRDATLALVRWWLATGDDGSGTSQILTSASIAGVSLGFGNAGKDQPSMKYGPRVPGILARAGLMGRGPYLIG